MTGWRKVFLINWMEAFLIMWRFLIDWRGVYFALFPRKDRDLNNFITPRGIRDGLRESFFVADF